MRAHFIKDLSLQDSYQLRSDDAHHLIHVARLEVGEELLLLDGMGFMVWTEVIVVSRKEIILKQLRHERRPIESVFDLALGIPKKEALELSLKQAVELGCGTVYLIRSDYSQTKIPEQDRIEAILISALEQSNSPYLPKVKTSDWSQLPIQDFSTVWWMNSIPGHCDKSESVLGDQLLVVGPEGGFSPKEIEFFSGLNNLKTVHLPTPILRTPTAVAAGAGFLMGRLLN